MGDQQATIGPLVFRKNTPKAILTQALLDLGTNFASLSRSRVTELSLSTFLSN